MSCSVTAGGPSNRADSDVTQERLDRRQRGFVRTAVIGTGLTGTREQFVGAPIRNQTVAFGCNFRPVETVAKTGPSAVVPQSWGAARRSHVTTIVQIRFGAGNAGPNGYGGQSRSAAVSDASSIGTGGSTESGSVNRLDARVGAPSASAASTTAAAV